VSLCLVDPVGKFYFVVYRAKQVQIGEGVDKDVSGQFTLHREEAMIEQLSA